MSAGPALVFESPAASHFDGTFGLASRMDSGMQGSGAGSSNINGSAFSDEDLIASLAGFAVEGQTERDLATIKSMLLQQHSFGHANQPQQFTHNSYSSSNGGGGGPSHWPMASPAAATSAWTSFQWNPASGQPPPNTPTLSKSMELYSTSAQQQHLANEYFGGAGYFSARRRDVSLERPQLIGSSSRTSSRHGRSASIASSVNADSSSLSTGPDMDMEEEYTPSTEAGPSNPSLAASTCSYLRPQQPPAFAINGSIEGSHSGSGMEDIQEDRMRESMEDTTARTQQQIHDTHARLSTSPSFPIASPSSTVLDSRTERTGAGIAEKSPPFLSSANHHDHKQWRSNTSTPVSSNRHSHSRPHSANDIRSPSSPPQTRSRSRQQQAAAAAAAGLRFTSP